MADSDMPQGGTGTASPVEQPDCELAQLREQVESLQAQLAQARRMALLGELLGTTAHEFNNVLMATSGYAKMGLRHRDDATREKSLGKILSASARAAKICQVILGTARNRSGELEPTNLGQLADDVLLLLERELNKYRIAVDRQYGPAPPAMVNASQIQQVLINLLVNARQAMPGGGSVFVRIRHDGEEGTVDLTIRDTGGGIPADKLPRIFDPYFTTKKGPDESGKGGTGLGLSSCREIIEAHRGKIRVASTEGKGTAFTLKLPAARAASPAVSAAAIGTMPQSVT